MITSHVRTGAYRLEAETVHHPCCGSQKEDVKIAGALLVARFPACVHCWQCPSLAIHQEYENSPHTTPPFHPFYRRQHKAMVQAQRERLYWVQIHTKYSYTDSVQFKQAKRRLPQGRWSWQLVVAERG